tara:strand:+ start:418 stop:1221 length:804 start_codon:yes stop_codon:yes gene_type:complete
VENLPIEPDSQSGSRLQKILSAAGIASRRAAEKLMTDGRVTVNGNVVKRLGTRADQSKDDIRVDGRRVGSKARRRYLLVNKPRGVVTTRHDPERRKTVADLVARIRDYVYPVGRLDYDSEGLLLLTNDGQLAQELTHPKHSVERVYQVTVEGVPSATQLRRLRQGIILEGRRTSPLNVRLISGNRGRSKTQSLLEITLREGRNRQVRRMLDAIGHPVARLRRIKIGPISDRTLRLGQYRDLSRFEVNALKSANKELSERGQLRSQKK